MTAWAGGEKYMPKYAFSVSSVGPNQRAILFFAGPRSKDKIPDLGGHLHLGQVVDHARVVTTVQVGRAQLLQAGVIDVHVDHDAVVDRPQPLDSVTEPEKLIKRLRRNAWSGEEAAPPSDIGGSSFAEWIAVSGYWRSDVPMSVSLDGVPCRVAGLRQRHIEDDGLLLLPYQDGVPGARLNRTARIIWEQCDGRTSVRTITASLAEMLDCGAERIAQDVSTAIQHLLEAKVVSLLDGPLPFLDGNPFRP